MSFLPGMFPAGAIASKPPPPTTLSQVASSTSLGASITGPAAIQAGDLLVLWDAAFSASLPATALPPGFTSIFNVALSPSVRAILSYKIATGAEASASLSGMTGTDSIGKCLYVFRGDNPISAVAVGGVGSEATGNDPAPKIVPASGQPTPLVVIGAYGIDLAIDPRTFTPAKDGEISTSNNRWLAHKIYNSSPANVTVDMDDEGSRNVLGGCFLSCS